MKENSLFCICCQLWTGIFLQGKTLNKKTDDVPIKEIQQKLLSVFIQAVV